jgi:16S rRNA (guanine(1405)-N(7))-methyltransferase
MNIDDLYLQELVIQISNTRKYRRLGLNKSTIENLIQQEAIQQTSQKALVKAVKQKLHNIVAPYLDSLDYSSLSQKLNNIQDCTIYSQQIRSFCLMALSQHASTAERIPVLESFFIQLFDASGKPGVIIDLACGLNPLAFPWMGLPTTVHYYAYDIIQPRVDFINQFFKKIGLAPLAENRDILVNPPKLSADLGLFFKEAHRFEKRQPGSNRNFWNALNVKKLAISLPVTDLSGSHSLYERHKKLVNNNLPDSIPIQEIVVGNELIFLIDKTHEN